MILQLEIMHVLHFISIGTITYRECNYLNNVKAVDGLGTRIQRSIHTQQIFYPFINLLPLLPFIFLLYLYSFFMWCWKNLLAKIYRVKKMQISPGKVDIFQHSIHTTKHIIYYVHHSSDSTTLSL